MDAIFHRRSIRKYVNEAVSDEKIHKILLAGMSAPNAFATYEWNFLVIKSAEGKKKMLEAQPWAKSSENADTLILVCGDSSKEKNEILLVQNCSAAMENMLIEATYLDLGSLWLGVYGSDEIVRDIRKAYNVPKHLIPIGVVVIGQTVQDRKPHDQFYKDQVHVESFKK